MPNPSPELFQEYFDAMSVAFGGMLREASSLTGEELFKVASALGNLATSIMTVNDVLPSSTTEVLKPELVEDNVNDNEFLDNSTHYDQSADVIDLKPENQPQTSNDETILDEKSESDDTIVDSHYQDPPLEVASQLETHDEASNATELCLIIRGNKIPLNKSQKIWLQALQSGEQYAPSSLLDMVIEGSLPARRQQLSLFIRQVENSSLSNRFSATGWARGRRYQLLPEDNIESLPQANPQKITPAQIIEAVEIQPSSIDKPKTVPTPASMPQRLADSLDFAQKRSIQLSEVDNTRSPLRASESALETKTIALTDWGLAVNDNGTRYATLNEKQVYFSPRALEILVRLSASPKGQTTFFELLSSMRQINPDTTAGTLNVFIEQLKDGLQNCGIIGQLEDNNRHGDHGDMQRFLALVGAKEIDVPPDFFVKR